MKMTKKDKVFNAICISLLWGLFFLCLYAAFMKPTDFTRNLSKKVDAKVAVVNDKLNKVVADWPNPNNLYLKYDFGEVKEPTQEPLVFKDTIKNFSQFGKRDIKILGF